MIVFCNGKDGFGEYYNCYHLIARLKIPCGEDSVKCMEASNPSKKISPVNNSEVKK